MDTNNPETPVLEQCYLIHDTKLDLDALADISGDVRVIPVPWSERDTPPRAVRVLLYLGDEQVRDLAHAALEQEWEVGILPHPEARQVMAALGVKGELEKVFAHYLQVQPIEVDALTCNDELVFSSVVIGRVLALRPYDINRPQTNWSLLTGALKGLAKLSLKPYKLTTEKEREISIAALGLVVIGQTQSALVGRSFSEDLGIADGRLSLLALAPRSIASYLWFILRLLWPRKIQLSQLPTSLSLIQTGRLHVTAPEGAEYLLDGKPVHASEIELTVLEKRLQVLPGPALIPRPEESRVTDKERVRLNHAPVEEGASALVEKRLPLFSHATEEEYRDLFVSLRDSARASSSYKVLMVLSVLLALVGMYANSPPVIIGAMILAPLMSPVVSLAMGLARTDSSLIGGSLRTLGVGVGWGLACTLLVAWVMPLETPTLEMKARMSPNLLDLFVAIISGVAGAYASAKEEIAKSLAGVAIAVALVPPLAVTGIAFGWGEWAMAGGALLLLITNLVGIAVAASMTFLVMGFAPFKRARAGLGVSLLLILLISAPLSLSFSHVVSRDRIMEQVPRGQLELGGIPVNIGQVRVSLGEPHIVTVVLSAPQRLDEAHVDELKEIISERVGEAIVLEAQFSIRR